MKRPFVIGICGNSGSGKSSLLTTFTKLLGSDNVLFLSTDDYHKWPRGAKEWSKYTHLNPKANNLSSAGEHLEDLLNGDSAYKLEYCHRTGQLIGPFRAVAKPYIIIEGLHTFYTEQLRKHIDLKIYLDVDYDLITHFKVHRDMRERGHSKETVLKSIESREEDSKKYIYPQKEHADLVIHKKPLIKINEEKENTPVEYNFIHNNDIDITELATFLQKIFGKGIEHSSRDHKKILSTKKILNKNDLEKFGKVAEEKLNLNLRQDIYGLCQLVTAYNLCSYGHKIGHLTYPFKQ